MAIMNQMCMVYIFISIIVHKCHSYAINGTVFVTDYHTGRYGIDDLLYGQFSYKISDDIDMDPCKAGMAIMISTYLRF